MHRFAAPRPESGLVSPGALSNGDAPENNATVPA